MTFLRLLCVFILFSSCHSDPSKKPIKTEGKGVAPLSTSTPALKTDSTIALKRAKDFALSFVPIPDSGQRAVMLTYTPDSIAEAFGVLSQTRMADSARL